MIYIKNNWCVYEVLVTLFIEFYCLQSNTGPWLNEYLQIKGDPINRPV